MGLPAEICWHALKMFGLSNRGIDSATNFMWSPDGKRYVDDLQKITKQKQKEKENGTNGNNFIMLCSNGTWKRIRCSI